MIGFSKNGSLVALLLASRTLATPLLESLIGRDLSLLSRADSKCVTSFTSGNGLNFTNIQCNQNNPFNDALDPFTVDSMTGCMEFCSRFWGNGEGCFGVVWRESDNQCWMRNSTTSKLSNNKTVYTKTLLDEDGTHSALVDLNQMKPLDTDCPAADKSHHDLDGYDGISYTVQCNKDIGGSFDAHWSYEYHNNPFQAYYHATSLEDCLKDCVSEHPLCRGVVYIPGLTSGYANCWPKTGFSSPLSASNTQLKITHSATIDSITTPNTDCNKNETYTSTQDDSKNFAVHCGQTNQGTNMTMVHTQNLTSCMEECAGNKQGCVGVVYDSTLQSGYNNCYLQNTSSIFNDIGGSTYAVLTGAKPKASGTGSNNSNNSNDGGSSSGGSKAWIAGAVVGPILGLALIGAAIFFLRRRKPSAPPANVSEVDAGAAKHIPYDHQGPAPAYAPIPQYSPQATPNELGSGHGHQRVEMEGQSAAKYAQKGGASQGGVVHEMG
ncbi:hypothetical protein P171DRAFT_391481 [Karstenula rhodostoma CBS 690.94]|uniref:Apple domain-containing protein n=1 Tax=Karstenula rhodostoma CBS 690.94 TaxID=1392251 RepID=A0A9P4PHV7_9PLEO|nr:hypothetical protein P171DRAFT_391481 [Karstenula rhodostoma CBS 690.94]